MKHANFSLKTNVKAIANGGKEKTKKEKEERNEQFEYINKMLSNFAEMGLPAISVDKKMKEPIGNFKNPGTRYKREADLTNDHDFLTYAAGIAALYGVYDQQQNKGFVSIGMFRKEGKTIVSSDTPEFAVESIERWWGNDGLKTYRSKNDLLIVADGGGSNGHRPHMCEGMWP